MRIICLEEHLALILAGAFDKLPDLRIILGH